MDVRVRVKMAHISVADNLMPDCAYYPTNDLLVNATVKLFNYL